MKEKLLYFWKHIISPLLFFVIIKTIDRFYGDEIAFYYDQIPKPLITSGLLLLLIYVTYKSFSPVKEELEIIFIPNENDYENRDASIVISILLVVGFVIFASIFINLNINYIILFLIVLISITSNIILKKTASFQIKEEQIIFKSGKEERTFNVSEITSLEVFPNQIILFKKDSQELISFLQLEKEDFYNIKTYFNKRVPEISVNLAKAVTQ